MPAGMIGRAQRCQVGMVGLPAARPFGLMIDIRVKREPCAPVASACAMREDEPVPLHGCGAVGAPIHIKFDAADGIGRDAVEGTRFKEHLPSRGGIDGTMADEFGLRRAANAATETFTACADVAR